MSASAVVATSHPEFALAECKPPLTDERRRFLEAEILFTLAGRIGEMRAWDVSRCIRGGDIKLTATAPTAGTKPRMASLPSLLPSSMCIESASSRPKWGTGDSADSLPVRRRLMSLPPRRFQPASQRTPKALRGPAWSSAATGAARFANIIAFAAKRSNWSTSTGRPSGCLHSTYRRAARLLAWSSWPSWSTHVL